VPNVIEFEFPAEREFESAGHGLYASAGDYLTIQRVLLGQGEVDGVRLLRPETVELLGRDHLAPIPIETHASSRPEFSRDMDLGGGLSFGLDISITTERRPGLRRVGSLGWCGTFNSYYWVDPDAGVTGAVHMQYLPFYDEQAVALAETFERAVYAARGG
jgi:CubicO group peptidase (beta-lactamase class C family)